MRELMLILHFIGLAMGLGTSMAFMFLGMASSKMEKAEAMKFMKDTSILSRMGHIGLALLILSGLYLITPHWESLTQMPLLMIKLVLVIVLGAMIGIVTSVSKKITPETADAQMKKLKALGPLTLLTTLTIIVLAVLHFQ